MERSVCFSTSNLRRWAEDVNKQIDFIRGFDVDGVELVFRTMQDLDRFKPTLANKKFLGNGRVSVHAPFDMITTSVEDPTKTIRILDDFSSRMDSETLVVHPEKTLELDLLDDSGINYSIENIKKDHLTHSSYSKILRQHKSAGFVLDIAHTFVYSDKEAGWFMDNLSDRISQFHFSGTARRKTHVPLCEVSNRFWKSVECVKNHKAPIVIESFFQERSISLVRAEVLTVREWLE
jgi:hypothetical protein